MTTRLGLARWTVLAAAGGASFYGAIQLATPDVAQNPGDLLVRDVSAQPGPAATAALAPPADAPAATPPVRDAIEVGNGAEAFGNKSWLPPPPPPPPAPAPAAPERPPKPTAPPLPFRFVGMLEAKNEPPTAFLSMGDALHVVKVGDVIDGTYRIEALSPAKVVVTYLPLKQQQTLGVDGGQP